MRIESIGVAGVGFVGSAVVEAFKPICRVARFDNDPKKSDSLAETLARDAVFVCLPTPMAISSDGRPSLKAITEFMERAAGIMDGLDHRPIVIIKSTVPVGTTAKIARWAKWGRFVHNPEFLREKTALEDFTSQRDVLLGGSDDEAKDAVFDLYERRFPGIGCTKTSSDISEMVKYVVNGFLATKVLFFNEVKRWAEAAGVDFDTVRMIAGWDQRVGASHTQVPGPDGLHGFGGSCFPKDYCAMIHQFLHHHLNADLLMTAWRRNMEIRERAEWKESCYGDRADDAD